jgi:hypothetical protein
MTCPRKTQFIHTYTLSMKALYVDTTRKSRLVNFISTSIFYQTRPVKLTTCYACHINECTCTSIKKRKEFHVSNGMSNMLHKLRLSNHVIFSRLVKHVTSRKFHQAHLVKYTYCVKHITWSKSSQENLVKLVSYAHYISSDTANKSTSSMTFPALLVQHEISSFSLHILLIRVLSNSFRQVHHNSAPLVREDYFSAQQIKTRLI